MNKKNGFSLIEILAIIVVVGIISGIAIPNIKKISEKEESEKRNSLNKKIENATKLYVAKFKASNLVSGNEIKIDLNNLVETGLLELKDGECKKEDNTTILDGQISIKDNLYNYGEIEKDNCYKKYT